MLFSNCLYYVKWGENNNGDARMDDRGVPEYVSPTFHSCEKCKESFSKTSHHPPNFVFKDMVIPDLSGGHSNYK